VPFVKLRERVGVGVPFVKLRERVGVGVPFVRLRERGTRGRGSRGRWLSLSKPRGCAPALGTQQPAGLSRIHAVALLAGDGTHLGGDLDQIATVFTQ